MKTHKKEPLICDMCGKHFTRRANMKHHIENLCNSNTKQKRAKIQAEVERFHEGTEQSWVRYNVTPSGDFTCADCDFQTETVAQIVKHRYSEHGEEDRLKNKKRIRQNKNRNRQRKGEGFSCPNDDCNKNFISTNNLGKLKKGKIFKFCTRIGLGYFT